MLEAIVLGLIQGLTEFLPVSSSGHLRLVPDLFGMRPPDLATSAVLHLGTLGAVVTYYRTDIARIVTGARRDPSARRTAVMIVLATIPAAVAGLSLGGAIYRFQESSTAVGAALLATSAVLLLSGAFSERARRTEDLATKDAAVIGISQALALLPGISRSGMVIVAGLMRGLSRHEAARFGFLMAIPVTVGAGTREAISAAASSALSVELVVATLVAGVSGYWAISVLIRVMTRAGLWPFGLYCAAAGSVALVVL